MARNLLVPDGGETAEETTVLIADDDDATRESLKLWLTGDRWDVQEAADGAETLTRLDDTVDVLLLDRGMPNVSGSEVVDRLDETAFTGTVIVVSAYKPDEQLGGDDVTDYLVKPLERDPFLAQLRQSLP